jgi:hypothetical protein
METVIDNDPHAAEDEPVESDPQVEYLQQLVRRTWLGVRTLSVHACLQATHLARHAAPLQSQIRDNEFLQRENLLLEAYLAKLDVQKLGINFDDLDPGKVRKQTRFWRSGMQ